MSDKFADIPEGLMSQYKDTFKLFDSNQDGVIDKEEFAKITKLIKMEESEESIQQMIDTIGSDDKVTFNQFIAAMSGKMKNMDSEEEVMDAFKAFDEEGNGKVKADSLTDALSIFCPTLSEKDREELIKDAEVDEEGFLVYEKFVKKLFDFS